MPSIKPVGNEDETTRAYLDEIGKIPRIDHRKEQEHGLIIAGSPAASCAPS